MGIEIIILKQICVHLYYMHVLATIFQLYVAGNKKNIIKTKLN